jgi:hypothetical protein
MTGVNQALGLRASEGLGKQNKLEKDLLEIFLFINDLDAMFVAAGGRLFADGREVAVHDNGDVDGGIQMVGWTRRWERKRERRAQG